MQGPLSLDKENAHEIAHPENAINANTSSMTDTTPNAGILHSGTEARKSSGRLFDLGHVWAFARREAMELIRDPIRIVFALLEPFSIILNHLTGFSRLLARHAFRLGLADHKESITKSGKREKPAFGGPKQSIGVVTNLARCAASRYGSCLAE